MSILDKAIAAVTPPESDQDRAEARRRAESMALEGDFLSQILDHHRAIERAFAEARSAPEAASRKAKCKELGVILTGHAIAEEATIYPALAEAGEKGQAAMGYEEQSMVKIQMALLEKLDPMSQDWVDKLEHIRGAVAHHMYEEEGTWFPELKQRGRDLGIAAQRYREEFERYTGGIDPSARASHSDDMLIQPMQGNPAPR